MIRILVATACFLHLIPANASPHCGGAPCPLAAPPPTHFIAELQAGSTTFGGGGPAVGALLGVGGKLRGFPPIFYLVGEATYFSSSEDGDLGALSYSDERSSLDLLVGPRVYIPIFGPVRIFGEALFGTSHVDASFRRSGEPTYSRSDWTLLARLGIGLQVRVFHFLSVGFRFVVSAAQGGLITYTDAVEAAGGDPATRTAASASLTWHF